MGRLSLFGGTIISNMFLTGLEHCGPAWQPLEIATLFLSLSGLHRLEVLGRDYILHTRVLPEVLFGKTSLLIVSSFFKIRR